MRPSLRVLFLISAAVAMLHVSVVTAVVVLGGYIAFEQLDWWLARAARGKKFDDIIFEWEQSKEDPENEEKGQLSRVRLNGQNQIITARVADLLRETF